MTSPVLQKCSLNLQIAVIIFLSTVLCSSVFCIVSMLKNQYYQTHFLKIQLYILKMKCRFFFFQCQSFFKASRLTNQTEHDSKKSAIDFVIVINSGVLDCCQTLSDTHRCLHGTVLYVTLTEIMPAWC